MAHIHTNPGEHDQTISAFIIRDDLGEPKLMLHMHKKLHVLLQPGGHIELNENPWQAISHEIAEETGYSMDQLQILQPKGSISAITGATLHPQPVVYNTHNFDPEGNHRHTDISYAFVTSSDPTLELDEGESADIRWVSRDELVALDAAAIFQNVREVGLHVLENVYTTWDRVDTGTFNAA